MSDHPANATQLLDRWSAEPPSNTIAKAVVVDRLLDLRNVAEPATTAVIDHALARTPGVNVVPGEWWRAQIDQLRFDLLSDGATAIPSPSTKEDRRDVSPPPPTGPADDRTAGRWFRRRPRTANDADGDQRV